ncbi:CRISPR-associated protein Csx20 [Hugenholtzia roseola]|uniref:CRISPR-associated protein Csx20 n=1 Tax=Hugenholtzia roseola TaxID=1002 RepID=UPI0003F75AC8|nr:CRISPR-associated protein Csx20 [Hugenholtzia roseola]
MTLHLLFSHALTVEQVSDARNSLGVGQIETLPADLQVLFSNVPPDLESLQAYAEPLLAHIRNHTQVGDYLLIQGDFGMTTLLVSYCLKNGRIPLYATTERQSIDEVQPDGSIKTQRIFRHKRFRKYEAF